MEYGKSVTATLALGQRNVALPKPCEATVQTTASPSWPGKIRTNEQ